MQGKQEKQMVLSCRNGEGVLLSRLKVHREAPGRRRRRANLDSNLGQALSVSLPRVETHRKSGAPVSQSSAVTPFAADFAGL